MNIGTRIARKFITKFPATFVPLHARWMRSRYRQMGLSRGVCVLSFDNDYAEDNRAAAELLPLLNSFQIKATWAVIGMWVEKFPDLHRQIISAGHELINHTWSHPDSAELRSGDPRKFNEMSNEELEAEIARAHTVCIQTLNYEMKGFRSPHFRIHAKAAKVLQKYGYRFTSEVPALETRTFGLPHESNGLLELPLSNIPRRPDRLPETYRLFRSPNGLYDSERQFFTDFCELINLTAHYGLFTCLYLDPMDVQKLKAPTFSAYLEVLKKSNVDVVTMRQAAALFEKRN